MPLGSNQPHAFIFMFPPHLNVKKEVPDKRFINGILTGDVISTSTLLRATLNQSRLNEAQDLP